MLHPAKQVFTVGWIGIQIVECLDSVSVLKVLSAIFAIVMANHDEFFAFVLSELSFQFQLLLS